MNEFSANPSFIYVPRTRGYEKKVFSPYNKAFYNLAKG